MASKNKRPVTSVDPVPQRAEAPQKSVLELLIDSDFSSARTMYIIQEIINVIGVPITQELSAAADKSAMAFIHAKYPKYTQPSKPSSTGPVAASEEIIDVETTVVE